MSFLGIFSTDYTINILHLAIGIPVGGALIAFWPTTVIPTAIISAGVAGYHTFLYFQSTSLVSQLINLTHALTFGVLAIGVLFDLLGSFYLIVLLALAVLVHGALIPLKIFLTI